MSRFAGFKFKAPHDFAGKPVYTLPTVPARDLDSEDVAALTKEQYEDVKAALLPNGKPLYEPIRRDNDADDEIEVEVALDEDEFVGEEAVDTDDAELS